MDTDLVIIGAGPAGCALALQAADAGLRVVMMEGARFPRRRPGETLHPGVEPILAKLGVWPSVAAAGFHRQRGVHVSWGGERAFRAYGEDADGAWLGLQADRAKFDALLLDAVREKANVRVMQPSKPTGVMESGGRVYGVRTTEGEVSARWVADAAGGGHWLAGQLGMAIPRRSSPLSIRFGWRKSARVRGDPVFAATRDGWKWNAPLGNGRDAWCRLQFSANGSGAKASACDVTWRCAERAAGPGWFLVGDAAAVLDPASSHGVLRALMGGMMAAHVMSKTGSGDCDEATAYETYSAWVRAQFEHDFKALQEFYAQHPAWSFLNETTSSRNEAI